MERELIGRIEDFPRAMGGLFAFMGSQYRLEVDGRELFIELLLFHRRLRCLVAIELASIVISASASGPHSEPYSRPRSVGSAVRTFGG